MPGLVDTPHEVFVARHAVKVDEPTDPVEAGVVRWVPLTDIPSLISDGQIGGSGALVGLLMVMSAGR
jgi:hypothetical protein